MTDHLPECDMEIWMQEQMNDPYAPYWLEPPDDIECQCKKLRACEQRIRNQDIATHHADFKEAKALLASRDEAWFAGVEAAREAVAACTSDRPSMRGMLISVNDALAAIDALREEKP